MEERRAWRKDHPHGFVAKPAQTTDRSGQSHTNLLVWDCKIPGKAGTKWEAGLYPVKLEFSNDYPSRPPKVSLPAGFFHPNVFPSGKICLSILNEDKAWKPSITVKQILVGVQDLLDNPNNSDPAQDQAFKMLKKSPAEYERRVRSEARKYAELPTASTGGGGGGTNDPDIVIL